MHPHRLTILGLIIAALTPAAYAAPFTTTTLTITSSGSAVTSVPLKTVITLTATVTFTSGGAPVTTGSVIFCDVDVAVCLGSASGFAYSNIGSAQLNSAGVAVFKFVPGIGTHSYQAVLVGTSLYTSSFSSALPLTVTGDAISISSSGSAGSYTLTGTVIGGGFRAPIPSGTVSFLDTTNADYVLGTVTLASGNRDVTFADSMDIPADNRTFTTLVAEGDFNNDGIPDLIQTVVSRTSPFPSTLQVLLGNGDGTFRALPLQLLAGNDAPNFAAAVGDFNGDGDLDLAVAAYGGTNVGLAPSEPPDTITIYLGHGDGTFTAVTSGALMSVTPSRIWSVVAADFNGDGRLDLAAINAPSVLRPPLGDNALDIFLGNGDGTFTPLPPYSLALSPANMAVGDFNGDGVADLAITTSQDSMATSPMSILLGNGDGTFTPTADPPVTSDGVPLIVSDFNGDGKADLALYGFPGTILLGNGDGSFAAPLPTSISGAALPVDLNEDGIQDLLNTDNTGGDGVISAYFGNGNGTFTLGAIAVVVPNTSLNPLFTADFNGDGTADIALNQFFDNDTSQASIFLTKLGTNPIATLQNVSPVGTGTHLIEAVYNGDGIYSSITSTLIPLTAEPVDTALAMTANPSPALAGQNFTLIASLTPATAQDHSPTGTVTFFRGATNLGTSSISGGVATLTGITLPDGASTLTASFGGDTNFSSSNSTAFTYTIEDFTLTAPSTFTLETQHHGSFNISLTSFAIADTIALSCGPLPPIATCTIGNDPISLAANGTATTSISIETDAVPDFKSEFDHTGITLAALLPLSLILLRRRKLTPHLLAILITLATISLSACSGKYPASTPPGTYNLALTGVSRTTNLTHTANITFIVTP